METVKRWQQGWFYVTEPRDSTWAAPAEFKSGPSRRLASWLNKGLDWASSDEVTVLQKRIKSMVDKNTSLAIVIQVMLFRQILHYQARQEPMWKFKPAGPQTLQRFFGTKHEDMWKLLFKNQKSWPETTKTSATITPMLCPPAGRRKRNGFTVRLHCPKTQLFLY